MGTNNFEITLLDKNFETSKLVSAKTEVSFLEDKVKVLKNNAR